MKKNIFIALLILSISYAGMIITKKNGTKINVDVNSEDIATISFTSSQPLVSSITDSKIIFEDTFDDGTFEDWTGSSSHQKVYNGVVEFICGNHSTFELKDEIDTENVIVEWKGSANKNGFHGFVGPYNFNIGGWNNTAAGCSGPGKPFKRINTGKVYTPGVFHLYRVERIGNTFKATVDGKTIFNEIIPKKDYSGEGKFRFTTYFATLKVDWIKIYRP